METFFKINDMTLADVDNCAVLEERIFAHAWSKKALKTHWQLKKIYA